MVKVAAATADTPGAWSEPEAVAIGDDYTELSLPAGRYLKVGRHMQKCRNTLHTVTDTAVSSITQQPVHCGLSKAAMHNKWPDLPSHDPPPQSSKCEALGTAALASKQAPALLP